MRKKNIKYLFFTAIFIYFLFGLFMFGINKNGEVEGQYLENNEEQEIGLKMSELENEVIKRINAIEQQKKDNILDSDILLKEIEISRQYLQEHFGENNITNEIELNLLYHSSFLKSLGENYGINDNDLLGISRAIHSYMIDKLCGSSNNDREKELKEEMEKMTEAQSLEVVKAIIE